MLKDVALALIGLLSSIAVSAGIFAFITMIGVVTRFAARTKTSSHIMLYEDMVIIGGTIGNIVSLYEWHLIGGDVILLFFGLFAGIYVGCLALALTETLKVFPILSKRINLTKGFTCIIICLGVGKCFGTLYQMYFQWKS